MPELPLLCFFRQDNFLVTPQAGDGTAKALLKQRLELPWLINEIILLKMAYFTACCELSFKASQATGRSSWAAFEGSVV